MANELSITYNGQTKTKDSGVVLNTAGRVMVTNMTITAAADPHTLYTPSSTYFKTGTSGAVSAASIPSNKYASATYYVKAATPAFDGGALNVSGSATALGTNASLSTTNESGIAVVASGTATPTRASVLYNGAVNGWVNKADNATALASGTGTAKALTSTTYYVNNLTVPNGKTLTVNEVSFGGELDIYDNAGYIYLSGENEPDANIEISSNSGYIYLNTNQNDSDVTGEIHVDANVGDIYINQQGREEGIPYWGSTHINWRPGDQYKVDVEAYTVTINGTTVTDSSGELITADPSFIGGTLTLNGSATYTSSNISVSATNSSGISVRPSAAFTPTRSSVLYASAVEGWVTKSNGAVALAADAGSSVSLNGDTIYITGVTVPSGKTFTVNGGGDKGVKVEYKKVTVDTYPVTDTNGDLLVPTYSGTSLTYPAPGIFSDSASTTSMSIQGNVTVINGLTVKDVNAVPGSGTAPSNATYNYYLAKWQTAASLTTGPKVTISTSTPSGGSNGDIWYQVL